MDDLCMGGWGLNDFVLYFLFSLYAYRPNNLKHFMTRKEKWHNDIAWTVFMFHHSRIPGNHYYLSIPPVFIREKNEAFIINKGIQSHLISGPRKTMWNDITECLLKFASNLFICNVFNNLYSLTTKWNRAKHISGLDFTY